MIDYVLPLERLRRDDVHRVGGKNSSLGEMLGAMAQLGVQVPSGFATTADAYREFLRQDGLDERIRKALATLNVDDVVALARAGAEIRGWMRAAPLPTALQTAVLESWRAMDQGRGIAVAVRSSATAEDLPEASFAGQQETLLNVRGEAALLEALHEVYASLFTDRAISYRVHQGFDHSLVALSVGVQRMVRSDLASSGVMFTLDTDSGFREVVFLTSAWGLGETVVQGAVNPDEFYLYKAGLAAGRDAILRRNLGTKAIKMVYGEPGSGERVRTIDTPPADRARFSLTDAEATQLSHHALAIEKHYGCPMDIEWAKDGETGELFIVQARPETVQSRAGRRIHRFRLHERSRVLARGRSIGHRIGTGRARVIKSVKDIALVQPGDVLVADMTDPDWEPVMKRAAAIVTNRGGRTCHAAIIARELGVPAVVGCTSATTDVADGTVVTVSCAEGDTGHVYEGKLGFDEQVLELDSMPAVPVKIMMNVGNPDRAFSFAALPHKGVGLARLEFIINRMIGVHPRALLEFERLDTETKAIVRQQMAGYADPVTFFVAKLAEGVAQIAAAFAPEPVIVRLSDFKSNEYANLIGGRAYEPHEENPMLGFRGAARYLDPSFQGCFELECRALRYVREEMGLTNVQVMVPFVRTVPEARAVTELLARNGLARGEPGLKVLMMCELPSNALLADAFLEHFDGMSIGSNDMTQLALGVDRDSAIVASSFDERDAAVKALLSMAITACRKAGKYVGICGQGPSDHPDFAAWLVEQGIESVSLNPDSVVETWIALSQVKARRTDVRTVCFVSDRTGITTETLGHSLLSQFATLEFRTITMPFVSTAEEARGVVKRIDAIAREEGTRPVVFSTLVDDEVRAIVRQAQGFFLDFFDAFLAPLEAELHTRSAHVRNAHPPGVVLDPAHSARINATNYALANDDGAGDRDYRSAHVILMGVSRTSKTPTSLYLALQYGIFTANYPLAEEDLESGRLPAALVPYREKLHGLTITPERLQKIRQERRPDSRYASGPQVQYEVRSALTLFDRCGVPYLDVTASSVEEIASRILATKNLTRHVRG